MSLFLTLFITQHFSEKVVEFWGFEPWKATLMLDLESSVIPLDGSTYYDTLTESMRGLPYSYLWESMREVKKESTDEFENAGSIFMPESPSDSFGYITTDNKFVNYKLFLDDEELSSSKFQLDGEVSINLFVYAFSKSDEDWRLLVNNQPSKTPITAAGKKQNLISIILDTLYENSGFQQLPDIIQILGYTEERTKFICDTTFFVEFVGGETKALDTVKPPMQFYPYQSFGYMSHGVFKSCSFHTSLAMRRLCNHNKYILYPMRRGQSVSQVQWIRIKLEISSACDLQSKPINDNSAVQLIPCIKFTTLDQ
eukprot:NODE_154_length_16838_cov_0.293327.p6 type:complete len:311 gc:universal NODE_154_length_16838_cov_0.293327:11697-12629(+)